MKVTSSSGKIYSTEPIPAMKTVDKPGGQMNPMAMAGMAVAHSVLLAAVIEVPAEESLRNHTGEPGLKVGLTSTDTEVVFQKIFRVNEHNYLFTSACCMECIKVKHKKMLRAYLIDHGDAPGVRLWWKVWMATR